MSNFIFIPIVILSISAGLCAILITYQLQKKYRLGYLSAYLYFQIFINVFGLYGIMGQGLVKKYSSSRHRRSRQLKRSDISSPCSVFLF
ncbi:MAG: hypothetical protein OEZ45_02310 [Candidatus Aminicenantes bacterium]|nr:hypothetical protein [Candidatus Aminicenantes bacterium]